MIAPTTQFLRTADGGAINISAIRRLEPVGSGFIAITDRGERYSVSAHDAASVVHKAAKPLRQSAAPKFADPVF
jgi:hypothetical protein